MPAWLQKCQARSDYARRDNGPGVREVDASVQVIFRDLYDMQSVHREMGRWGERGERGAIFALIIQTQQNTLQYCCSPTLL